MFYSVDLTDLDYLKFKEVAHDLWKQKLFSETLAVLYSFETERGKEILAGSIIKANSKADSQEVQNIIQRVASLTPMLKELQSKYPISQTFCQSLSSDPEQMVTKEVCLNQLHAFCLKVKASLA